MSIVFLTLLIALLNLGLGYVAAVSLGYGPRQARVPGAIRTRGAPGGGTRGPQPSATGESVTGGSPAEIVCAGAELPLDESPIDELLDDDPGQSLDIGPSYEPYDDDIAELIHLDQPESWDLGEKFVETSILKLNIAMMKSGQRAAEIDERLRDVRGRSDQETIRQCVAQLLEDCRTYLEEQHEAAERFRSRISELGELKELGEEIEMANLEQAAQVETTISNLEHLDLKTDLEAANQRLLSELGKLRAARHRLRDNQEIAFLSIARYEDRMDTIEAQLFNDPLTKLRNRIGVETTLWPWWQQNRQQSRRMSAALFDLDGFGKVNEQYGTIVGDRILVEVAGLIQRQLHAADLVGRFGGQRFLVVLSDVGPRAAIKTAELIRQTIERATFNHGGEKFQVTATAGIIDVAPAETHESFLAKLEATLNHARRSGANSASFHDGREPEPVESPNLGADFSEINV